ncbi:MAG: CDP-alcohol phosphatidyltransferase family protein [Bacteroidota bacterium]
MDPKLAIVQLISVSRALAAFTFISIALVPALAWLSVGLLVYALISDFADGYLARKWNRASKTGRALDLFGDKYLTIICLTYAIARDLPIIPCSVSILREVFLLSMRTITLKNKILFPPNRIIGTLLVIPIWVTTLFLLLYPGHFPFAPTGYTTFRISVPFLVYEYIYWIVGILTLLNLIIRVQKNWKLIIESFKEDI